MSSPLPCTESSSGSAGRLRTSDRDLIGSHVAPKPASALAAKCVAPLWHTSHHLRSQWNTTRLLGSLLLQPGSFKSPLASRKAAGKLQKASLHKRKSILMIDSTSRFCFQSLHPDFLAEMIFFLIKIVSRLLLTRLTRVVDLAQGPSSWAWNMHGPWIIQPLSCCCRGLKALQSPNSSVLWCVLSIRPAFQPLKRSLRGLSCCVRSA